MCGAVRDGSGSYSTSALREDNGILHRRLRELRYAAGPPETVSLLRVCDVAVRMSHHTATHSCR
ncbi:DUF6308 family protein [Streptomyces chartreusis]|uniref:DUF6308 family protein n=1 Tax=Streptomyces chartreusis TaxID=1969 RepID=UPI0036C6FA5D